MALIAAGAARLGGIASASHRQRQAIQATEAKAAGEPGADAKKAALKFRCDRIAARFGFEAQARMADATRPVAAGSNSQGMVEVGAAVMELGGPQAEESLAGGERLAPGGNGLELPGAGARGAGAQAGLAMELQRRAAFQRPDQLAARFGEEGSTGTGAKALRQQQQRVQ